MEMKQLELLCECLTKKEATDVVRELTECNCEVRLLHTCEGYSVYASGNLPEWENVDDCE